MNFFKVKVCLVKKCRRHKQCDLKLKFVYSSHSLLSSLQRCMLIELKHFNGAEFHDPSYECYDKQVRQVTCWYKNAMLGSHLVVV